ncbi:MAG TPA: hypothetical protein VIY52_00390, partial [Streptosporangiaceae bacterium]
MRGMVWLAAGAMVVSGLPRHAARQPCVCSAAVDRHDPGPAHDEVACPWPQARVCDRRAVGAAGQGGRPCAQAGHD